MQTEGIVHNGAIIVEGGIPFPEGTRVIVSAEIPTLDSPKKGRIEFPLVRSDKPGTLHLTNERIWELLDEEDTAPRH